MTPRETASLPNEYFENLYRGDPDPWRFATSDYERDKYAATLAALGDSVIDRGWEVGCSIGVFTHALAPRCKDLLAIDVSPTALAQARLRCAEITQVQFRHMRIPDQWPDGNFDAIIFSEVLYYLSPSDIAKTARRTLASLSEQAQILLVHWTGETNYPCSGDDAVEIFCDALRSQLELTLRQRHPAYRLDLLRRV